jgi:hypothetical protein
VLIYIDAEGLRCIGEPMPIPGYPCIPIGDAEVLSIVAETTPGHQQTRFYIDAEQLRGRAAISLGQLHAKQLLGAERKVLLLSLAEETGLRFAPGFHHFPLASCECFL